MASYCDKQRTAVQSYLNKLIPEENTYLKESVTKLAINSMVPANTDETVANNIIDYIQKYYSDNGNIVYAESFRVIPKTVLYIARGDIITILKRNRENPNEPLGIILSCGSTLELNFEEVPNEPTTISVTLTGGDDKDGFYTSKTVECHTAKEIKQLNDNIFHVTFDTPGKHTLTGISKKMSGIETISTTLTVNPSKNDPPREPVILLSSNPVYLTYGNTQNEPVDVIVSVSGGEDPEGKPVTRKLECSTASKIENISDTEYRLTFSQTGNHVITATSTDNGGKSTSSSKTLTVNPSKNDPPSAVSLSLSCGAGPLTLSASTIKVIATISGGIDPEGKTTTKAVTCPTAKSITKKNDTQFEVVFDKVGTHTISASATDPTGLSSRASVMLTINPEKNDPPTDMVLTLSSNTLTLGTGTAAWQTVTVNITGGIDPEGKAVTKTVECTTAKQITKINDNKWQVTFDTVRMHVIIATATDNIGLKSVQTVTCDVKGQSQSSGSTTMQFTNAKFDSGWSDLISGCYVSGITLSLVISSGHNSSTDYLVILGKKTDGTEVILRDNFNTSNRFKEITEGQEVANSMYGKGNLGSTTWSWNKDPYTLTDGIRQVRFVCETPGHADCAKSAKVTFNMDYTYDPSLT